MTAAGRTTTAGQTTTVAADPPFARASARARVATTLVAVVVPLLGLAWLGAHRSTVDAGADLLRGADHRWLVGAFAVASMTWVAGAVCQQGAVAPRLPGGRLLAVQFAGSAANHLLPAGFGIAALNLRFLRKHGLSRSSALNAVGLNTCAGVTVHLLAVVVLISAGFAAPPASTGTKLTTLIIVAAVAGSAFALACVPTIRRRATRAIEEQVRSAVAQWAVIGRRPKRAVQLWGGSAAVPVLHAVTLAFVVHALRADIDLGTVLGIYFVASAVSALIPSPGGFGALDAALIVALTTGGMAPATALATVVAYRLITVWLPLLPAACLLGVLHHRRVV